MHHNGYYDYMQFYNPVKVMADNEKASINEAYYSGQEILTYNDDMLSVNDKELSDNSNTTDTSDKDGICPVRRWNMELLQKW